MEKGKIKMTKYYWQGFTKKHEVWGFEFDEDKNVLTLYNREHETITEIYFDEFSADLTTFTDEEINEYLIDFFEEYTFEDEEENNA